MILYGHSSSVFAFDFLEALPRPQSRKRMTRLTKSHVAHQVLGQDCCDSADTPGPCAGRIVRSASIFGAAEVVVVGQRKWRLHGLHGYVSMPQKHFYTVP
jgi:hypothetical protein